MPGWWARDLEATARLREIVRIVHRWVGLAAGLVVCIVGLSGALYVFAPELTALYTARYSRVTAGPELSPLAVSLLARRAHAALEAAAGPLPDLTSRWVTLSAARDRVAQHVAYRQEPPAWYQVHIDPYRGDVLAVRDMRWDPMEVIRRVHQALLLPHDIGHVIVGIAILIFVGLQLTGLVLWLPRRIRALRHPGALRQRLTVHWRGRRRRVIYDLHRVFGVYGLLVALIIALSGLVWSFAWMDRAVYWVASGGRAKPAPPPVRSGPPMPDGGEKADTITQVGVYLQDQMKLFDKLTLLLGGRFDVALHEQEDYLNGVTTDHEDYAFTYRVGLLYQFIPGLATYVSYATSFQPVTFGARADGVSFDPETGQQVEGGFKVDMLGGRLTGTIAAYYLTRQNVTVDDPANEGFSIQTGEQRSQGVEVSVQARIVDGWDVLAFYAYTDGEITEDTTFAVGNRLPNTPRHSGGLWTTWTFPTGPFKGLGAGFGFRYVGERPVDLSNTLTLDDYVVLDASLFYRRGRLSVDLNFKNLTSETYFNGNGTFVFPGEPFSVLGRVA